MTPRVLIEDGVHCAQLPPAHIDSRDPRQFLCSNQVCTVTGSVVSPCPVLTPILQAVPPLWPNESNGFRRSCPPQQWPWALWLLAAVSVLTLIPCVAGELIPSSVSFLSVHPLSQVRITVQRPATATPATNWWLTDTPAHSSNKATAATAPDARHATIPVPPLAPPLTGRTPRCVPSMLRQVDHSGPSPQTG